MYGEHICAFPHILGSPSSYTTLHQIPSEFPYIWGKFCFLFLSVQGPPFSIVSLVARKVWFWLWRTVRIACIAGLYRLPWKELPSCKPMVFFQLLLYRTENRIFKCTEQTVMTEVTHGRHGQALLVNSYLCMDEWTVKTPNPLSRLFFKIDLLTEFAALCFRDFIDWRYIHSLVGIFDPACELLPQWTKELYLCNTLFLTRFRTYQIASPPQTKWPVKTTLRDWCL